MGQHSLRARLAISFVTDQIKVFVSKTQDLTLANRLRRRTGHKSRKARLLQTAKPSGT